MNAYTVYLYVHVVGALAWVGAALLMALLGARVVLARDPARTAAYAGDAEWLGLRLYLPANLVVLVSAALLVHEGPWGYGQLWIQLGLAGFAVSFVTGAAFFGPQWTAVGKALASEGAGSQGAERRIRRLLLVSFFDLGVLLATVFAMAVKPSADGHGALAVAAALPVAFTAIGLVVSRLGTRSATGPMPSTAGHA